MAIREGRFSSMRFNEWICVIAQYEKAVNRIGRQVYQGYSRGLVEDYSCIEMCKEISENFAEAKKIRAEMEEEYERDALDGLTVAEAKETEKIRERTQTEKVTRSIKVRFTKFMGRVAINRQVGVHRNRVMELSRDLGLRALAVYQDQPILKMKGHRNLCLLAEKLQADADAKWADIVENNADGKGSLSFHTIFVSFISSFANFNKGTRLGKGILKLFKYNAEEEEQKLTKQFEGSKASEALEAQLAETEEPELDVAKELETLERDFEETPEEWNLPPRQMTDGKWVPDTEKWDPSLEDLGTPEISSSPAPVINTHPTSQTRSTPEVEAPKAVPKPVVVRKKPAATGWDSPSQSEPSGDWTPDEESPSISKAPETPKIRAEEPTYSSPAIGDSFEIPDKSIPKKMNIQPDPTLQKPLGQNSPAPSWDQSLSGGSSLNDSWKAKPEDSWGSEASLSGWSPADDAPSKTPVSPPEPSPLPHDEDDDLLPDFLRNRQTDTHKPETEPFIPELPSFLNDEDAPSLEILPFGKSAHKSDDDEDDDKPFIPQMPDL